MKTEYIAHFCLVFFVSVLFECICGQRVKIKRVMSIAKKRNNGSKYTVINSKVTWFEAEKFCRKKNLRLITIEDGTTSKQISEELRGSDVTSTSFWTSGSDLAELGDFYWMANGKKITGYTNWLMDNPTPEERNYKEWYLMPNCIYLEKVRRNYLWNYDKCMERHSFVCESY